MKFKKKDIISIRDISKEEILYLLEKAKEIENNPQPDLLKGKVMGSLFFEPSTRTRLSFDTAMNKLGGKVIGFANAKSTSSAKGETLFDTIKMVEGYSDIIVMRHHIEGAARLAAETSSKPVLNAGDGANQHPTQTLLDLYTILKCKGTLDNLKIGLCGDLKYARVMNSLAYALSMFNSEIYLISPDNLKMGKEIINKYDENGTEYLETDDINSVISELDILYMTRIQQERFSDPLEYEKSKGSYVLTTEMLKNAKKDMKILHSLPRVDEVEKAVDDTPHAHYFEQAVNGVYMRQALLSVLLGELQ